MRALPQDYILFKCAYISTQRRAQNSMSALEVSAFILYLAFVKLALTVQAQSRSTPDNSLEESFRKVSNLPTSEMRASLAN